MKKNFLLLLLICMIDFACSKSTDQINQQLLSGTWQLKHYYGGNSYQDIFPTNPALIAFSSDNRFTSNNNPFVPDNGSYVLANDTSGNHYSNTIINLSGRDQQDKTYGIKLTGDSLYLYDGCCDAFTYVYFKLK